MIAKDGGRRMREDEIEVVTSVLRTVDRGKTERGAAFGIFAGGVCVGVLTREMVSTGGEAVKT